MRLARNLLLAAVAAFAAMALMATSAFGQAVEVVAEDGSHCTDVVETGHDTSSGCEITAASTANAMTFTHNGTSEAVTSSCENEFVANIDENGTGYIDTTETTIHTNPPTCPITACEEAAPSHAELEWPINGILEYGGGREEMVVTFCIRSVLQAEGQGSACTVLVDVSQNVSTHVITFTAADEPCHENRASELSGTWQTTGASEVEILHPHYPGDFGA